MPQLPFNKDLDIKLIKLVKESPVIYKTNESKYLNCDEREVVWQRIGDILRRPPKVCKMRWMNIRDMMRKKIRQRLRNPNRISYHYKYEHLMSFMLPYFREGHSGPDEEYLEFLHESVDVTLTTSILEGYNNGHSQVNELNSNCLEQYGNNKEDNACKLNPSDPIDVFLLSVGATLRKFDPYYLNQAKSKIFRIVQDYELEQIVDKKSDIDENQQ